MHGKLNFKLLLRNFDKFDPNQASPLTQTKTLVTSYLSAVNVTAWRPLFTTEQQKCQTFFCTWNLVGGECFDERHIFLARFSVFCKGSYCSKAMLLEKKLKTSLISNSSILLVGVSHKALSMPNFTYIFTLLFCIFFSFFGALVSLADSAYQVYGKHRYDS